jgi:hypothetical protein
VVGALPQELAAVCLEVAHEVPERSGLLPTAHGPRLRCLTFPVSPARDPL